MIDTLEHYICGSMPREGLFATNPNLRKKADDTGALLPFGGNTTVFLLDDETREKLTLIREELYRAAPDMLAERLRPETFHMTLHDLANGPADQPGLREWMAQLHQSAAERILTWRDQPPLRMRTTWLFNMVNTSIVLGLAPADGESWRRLDEMYLSLEELRPLGYALTPHITMAYFRPCVYSREQVERLSAALRPVDLQLTLSMEDLVLQNFTDMNSYYTVL